MIRQADTVIQTPFFGIGAMRGGTTWLSRVLEAHPDCGMHPLKELHFFDVRYNLVGRDFYRQTLLRMEAETVSFVSAMKEKFEKGSDNLPGETVFSSEQRSRITPDADVINVLGLPATPLANDQFKILLKSRVAHRFKIIASFAEFFTVHTPEDYADFLRRFATGCAAFGEITPSYALLPAAGFKEMATLFPGVKFIFIMRDPVDRLWSMAQYDRDRKAPHSSAGLQNNFAKFLKDPHALERSNYHHTIETLESAVPAEDIIYLFYEEMVTPSTGLEHIRRLELALGLNPIELPASLFDTRHNASEKIELSSEDEAAAREYFKPVYRFVADRFGQPSGWRNPQ